MRRALHLARGRAGRTWPNPTVGACIVRDGVLLSEAAHEAVGLAHAEAAALQHVRARGIDPRGATLYVTLEPCHHQGRTPPCTQAIVSAGLARVVYATDDDSPRHPGGGAAWLIAQGVEVERGPFAAIARELNHPFFETEVDAEVHLTLKIAIGLDGRMARRAGRVPDERERRITGPAAQRRVHRLRASSSAVLVGRGTVQADRPRLDLRHLPAAERPVPGPRAVVLDPSLRLPAQWLPRGALVLTAADPAVSGPSAHEIVQVPLRRPGRLQWEGSLAALAARGLGIVLVEAGPTLASELVAAALPHRIHLFSAPRAIGGEGPRLPPLPQLEERYRVGRVRRIGDDVEWLLRRDDLRALSA
jgi:diaminohydroxyphosphoribosylaminopyrimidine deaminase / 5-amino-6-(5-phosphoribosylamino)uracil reductase